MAARPKAGELVTVLPSRFGWDSWGGSSGRVERVAADGDVLVDLGSAEVWFHWSRLEPKEKR
ncbi:MAG: hypothetical protein AMXMBFR56_65690 [Polyangiaceae bacterium]